MLSELEKRTDPKFARQLRIMLILNSLYTFGFYYSFDLMSLFEEPILVILDIDAFKLSQLFTAATLPNIVLSPLVG